MLASATVISGQLSEVLRYNPNSSDFSINEALERISSRFVLEVVRTQESENSEISEKTASINRPEDCTRDEYRPSVLDF